MIIVFRKGTSTMMSQ